MSEQQIDANRLLVNRLTPDMILKVRVNVVAEVRWSDEFVPDKKFNTDS